MQGYECNHIFTGCVDNMPDMFMTGTNAAPSHCWDAQGRLNRLLN